MQIQMTGQNTEITPALRSYAEKKISRINSMVDKINHFHLVYLVEKTNQIVKANVSLPGLQIHAEASAPDMYESIDKLVDKISRQLSEHKEKIHK